MIELKNIYMELGEKTILS